MSSPTPTKEKTKWPLVGEEKELFVDFALGHRDTQIRSRIMFSQKVEIFRSCYNFEERKTMGLHICKEHLSKEADFPVTFPTLTSKEVAAEVKSIKQKCRDNLASTAGTSEQEKEVFALLDRINSHVVKSEIAPLFFASTLYEEYTNALGLYQIKNANVARATYPPVVMLDTLFADFKMEMESSSGPLHHHGVSLGASLSWQGGRGSPTASSIGDETSQSSWSTGDHSPTSNNQPAGRETKTSGRTSTGKLFRMKSKILKQNSVDRLAESSGGTGSAEKDNLSCSPNSFSSPEKAGNVSTTPTFYPTTVNGGNTLTPPSNPQSPGSVSNSSGSANSGNSSMSNSRQGLPRRKSTPHPRASSNLLFNFAPTSPSISIADDSLQQQQVHSADSLNCPKNVKVRLDASKQGTGESYTTSAIAVFKERDIFLFSTYRRSPENVRKESAMFGTDYVRGTATTHAFVCDMSGKLYGSQSQSSERYEDKAVLVCRKEKKLKTNDTKMEEYKVLAMTSFGVFEFPIESAETPIFQSSNLTNEIANYFSTVHGQKLSSFKEFKLKKLVSELDALEKNLIDALKIKSISIGIVSRQNTFEDSVEMLLKNRTISPAFDAFVTALAGPFDAFDHANKHVKSKAHSSNTTTNNVLPTFELPTISAPISSSAKYDRSTDRSASPEPAARANKSSSDAECDGRVAISPRGAVIGTSSSSMLSPSGGASQGLLSASKSSAGSATHSRESKEKSADSSSETSKSPILISNASTRHENMWCDDGSDPEDSGEGILLLAEDVAAKSVMSSTHDNLPGRVRREWNGVEMFWNLAPKLTKEEMRRYVGNCTSLVIFDEVGLNEPFDPLYLRLGKVTNFIVVVKPVVDESSASGFAYRIGYFIHYEQRWTPLNQSLSQAETLQDVERQIFNVNFGPAIQKNFVFQDTYIKPLLNLLINNATTAAYKHHHQVHLLARQPASAMITSFVKSHVPEAMK